jgi:hypothetical protein
LQRALYLPQLGIDVVVAGAAVVVASVTHQHIFFMAFPLSVVVAGATVVVSGVCCSFRRRLR